jgi:hypothetical protein
MRFSKLISILLSVNAATAETEGLATELLKSYEAFVQETEAE